MADYGRWMPQEYAVESPEMAGKQKKGLKDDIPLTSSKPVSFGSRGGRPRGAASQVNKKDLLDDDFFSKTAHETEDPDISDVDPEAFREPFEDMDDMDADLLGIKKPNSGPVPKPMKDAERFPPLTEPTRSAKKTGVDEKDCVHGAVKRLLHNNPL
ncbi:UNVERIFIED_CONTAM: hypothetical protein K2H54_014190 [Gekko kuhli]